MKKALCSLFVVSGLLLALPAQAQFAKPEDAVRYRQSAMNLINNHLGRISGQLKSGNPDMKAIQSSAMVIETLSKIQF
ncbi:MAG TPA: cytochrome c, partial [Burkholderiaceae bacterium]|nr:cytochrome c [Burkholderiaceae bacterium]